MQFPTWSLELLKVNEIFYSLQGESSFSGKPCIFIRLTGCNLRCSYCDTKYAYTEGKEFTIDEIINKVRQYRCPLIEITGGEPLLQNETPELAEMLCKLGYQVLIETNGTQNIDCLPRGVIRIIDIKCPSSQESERIAWENLYRLRSTDEIKFVIASQSDYEWAKNTVEIHQLTEKVSILFSPVYQELNPQILAKWILQDQFQVRFQIQLHKFLWPD